MLLLFSVLVIRIYDLTDADVFISISGLRIFLRNIKLNGHHGTGMEVPTAFFGVPL